MTQRLHRIYFDANDGPDPDRFGLWVEGSRRDIEPIADQLRNGLRVIIYQTGEMEMEAVLEFDPEWNAWTARPDWQTVKYLDGSGNDAPRT
jgi:hypothetical protein